MIEETKAFSKVLACKVVVNLASDKHAVACDSYIRALLLFRCNRYRDRRFYVVHVHRWTRKLLRFARATNGSLQRSRLTRRVLQLVVTFPVFPPSRPIGTELAGNVFQLAAIVARSQQQPPPHPHTPLLQGMIVNRRRVNAILIFLNE